jgi:polyhydroxyalkanoate synthesis regulator phasin
VTKQELLDAVVAGTEMSEDEARPYVDVLWELMEADKNTGSREATLLSYLLSAFERSEIGATSATSANELRKQADSLDRSAKIFDENLNRERSALREIADSVG